MRLLRPLVVRQIRPRQEAPEPCPAPNEGPGAAVVAALAGSPKARVLRTTLDGAFASPVLPRRTKLLMVAVVARALGCRRGEAEASADLAREGLGAGDVGEILDHLSSPRLDAREAVLVPFARETVRYRNADIQARTRGLEAHLETVELIEAVGIAALANGVCRLSVLLDAC